MRLTSILLLAAAAHGADFSGIWIGQMEGRNKEPIDLAFQFAQKGEALSGKLYGDYASSRIVEGKVAEGSIEFVVIVQEQAGNQINETRLRFRGALKDGKLEMTRERESSTNAGNAGGVQFRGNTSQTFTLRKLI